ncbi:MAG: glycosyltransferase [Pirellulales bacterium]
MSCAFARDARKPVLDLLEACRGADLIVAHALTYSAPIVAEQLGIRWIGTALQPMIFLSAYDPPILGPIAWLSRRRWGPKFHGRLLRFATNSLRSWAKPLDRIRREAGLPPAATHPLFAGMFSPLLNLVLFSRHLAAPQPDWPAHCVMCGFPFYDKGMNVEHGSLSPQLEAFLQSGEPPVVFTLGSSAVAAAGNFYRESFLAAKKFDIRSVLLIGRDERNRPTEPIPDHICVDDYAPYSLLFPRAGAVVHQGGVGTTGQVLRAGKPQIIVPFAHDQPDNAHRITELGCGLWLPRRKLQTDRLGAMLVQLREPRFRNKAAEIGAAVTAEDGCAAACDEIDRLFNT